jgi:hypothetical protein
MLHVPGPTGRLCDGVTRRDFLGVGSLSLIGLTLPQFLALKARAAAPGAAKTLGEGTFGKAKSVILIYLQGGPSHIDIWDPKPDAPQNIRGEFHPIPPSCRASSSRRPCRSSPARSTRPRSSAR